MASIETILQAIVDHPRLTASELSDQVEIDAADIQSRLAPYIKAGKVRTDKKRAESGREVFTYFPAQSLVDEKDGVKRIVTLARAPRAQATPANDTAGDQAFTFGFFSNGQLSISKGTREIKLSSDETSKLLAFLDSINIERIASA